MKPPALPSTIERALRAAGSGPGRTADSAISSSTFIRGLTIGALVGAAIAGSTIWERRRTRQRIKRELISSASQAGD
ncbi:MAG TPA: hypothetical protein VFO50_05905 [Candidatus Limnocylindrales bacterium]|nr:hypothetical protein [Candidatus Limnocylindrales bacterium]